MGLHSVNSIPRRNQYIKIKIQSLGLCLDGRGTQTGAFGQNESHMSKVLCLTAYILTALLLFSCGEKAQQEAGQMPVETLVRVQCGSCHLYPEPSLLPKSKWQNVLPRMALRLGIPIAKSEVLGEMDMQEQHLLMSKGIFPAEQQLPDSLWKKIENYYLTLAPDSLELAPRQYPEEKKAFKTYFPDINIGGPPFISMTLFDEEENLYLADIRGNLLRLDEGLQIQQFTQFPQPIVDLAFSDDGEKLIALSIGELYPNSKRIGAVAQANTSLKGMPELLFQDLPRPVHFEAADLDGDGLQDLVICNFGNYLGDLSWYRNQGDGTYEQRMIKEVPGATRVFVEDLNGDGQQDLVVLFAQGDEGVSLFFNERGEFKEKRVLRFHPLYGSNDFEFLDFDGDGNKDIVLTNGDNGDHSLTLKPYHGVRIFLNDGDFGFSQQYFFPMYGASKARARDFDQDGDLDIVAVSFFPDYEDGANQGIVYLENQGNFNFEPYRVPGADQGRWMVMDAGDFDKDGDTDVVVGSFTLSNEGVDKATMEQWRRSQHYLLVLENQAK